MDHSLRTSRQNSYAACSSGSLAEDDDEYMDDRSSTSTAGPPPDLPHSTGRFNSPWNLATAHNCRSGGSSPTSSYTKRNISQRTGSYQPFPDHTSSSSNRDTGYFPKLPTHSRTLSSTNASVSPMGSTSPQEFGKSFRLFNTSRFFIGGGTASASSSRPRDGSYQHLFRPGPHTGANGSVARSSGGEAVRNEGSFYNSGSTASGGLHQRQNSVLGASFANFNLNNSIFAYPPASELRNASYVFTAGPSLPTALFTNAHGGTLTSPTFAPTQPSRGSASVLRNDLSAYAMGGGAAASAAMTPTRKELPGLLTALRNHIALNGKTILVGDAHHALEIKRGSLIGSGGFAKVFVGVNTLRGELVAIKEIEVVDVDDVTALREIEQEFELLKSLRHPNIVNYMLFEHSRSQKMCRIVMEFLSSDSAFHLLKRFGPLSETILRHITRNLLNALVYIHKEGIFHRDVKPANILVSHKGVVKLCDFGCSKRITELSKATNCIIGTPVYMAPELIKGEATHKADIWSMGCSLFELATGLLPWYHSGVKDNLPLMFYITTTSESPLVLPPSQDGVPTSFSSEFMQFMDMCFTRDPTRRPEAAVLLQHPWLSGASTMPSAPAPSSSTSGTPRQTAYLLSLHPDSQDSVSVVRPLDGDGFPVKTSVLASPRDSVAALSNEDSFASELVAARTSLSAVAPPASAGGLESTENELLCQQELEEVSATIATDLCNTLMNFPEVSTTFGVERRLVALEGMAGTSESSPPITRTFSVPSPSITSNRGPVSVSMGDIPSPGTSPEHSILHDNFHYSQAQLGASAGNFVLPTVCGAEAPPQQYLRINEEGNLDFATLQEDDSESTGDAGHGKSSSAGSSALTVNAGAKLVAPGRSSPFSHSGGGGRAGDRRASPQLSVTGSSHFSSSRGESPSRGGAASQASPQTLSPNHPQPQAPSTPPPPLVAGMRQSSVALHAKSSSPNTPFSRSVTGAVPGANTSTSATEDEAASACHSPGSTLTTRSTSLRQFPEKARVASDGKLHMSFCVNTVPGQEMNVELNVGVNDVHCKMVDNQPGYFVAFSDDIKGQIAAKIKEAAAQSAANSRAPSVSSRTTSPRGAGGSSTSTVAEHDGGTPLLQRGQSDTTSGMHFYNSPSYRASRSPARRVSHVTLGSSPAVLQHPLSPHASLSQTTLSSRYASPMIRTVSPAAGASFSQESNADSASRASSPGIVTVEPHPPGQPKEGPAQEPSRPTDASEPPM